MKETRPNIINQAILLYNSQGVPNVSSKTIAMNLGISDGNLRYHFKDKEALVTGILERLLSEATELKLDRMPGRDNMADFKLFCQELFDLKHRYRCLFVDQVYLTREFNQYKRLWRAFLAQPKRVLRESLTTMSDNGALSVQSESDQFQRLHTKMEVFLKTWIIHCEATEGELQAYVDMMVSFLEPYQVGEA